MIVIKNKKALEKMREAGYRLNRIFQVVVPELLVVGHSTAFIDLKIERAIRDAGMVPECKGYGSYRHATCISVNDTIVHGVPSEKIILAPGDVVSIDVVASYKGYCADMARTYVLPGESRFSAVGKEMILVAQQALDEAIALLTPRRHLSDISAHIQKVVEAGGFGVIRDFVGHGIGQRMHEDPQVPNFGRPGEGPLLAPGMTLAIEPMLSEKSYKTVILSDGWTVVTVDGGCAVHVEDTVAIGVDGPEVFTRREEAP